MIVFCHLLNDNSGSPMVLRSTIKAVADANADALLFLGNQGAGCLDGSLVSSRKYWYQRSRFRFVTLVTYVVSQFCLYRALSRANLPHDALIFVNTLLPFGAMLFGRQTGRRIIVHIHEVSISPPLLRWFLRSCAARCADLLIYVSFDHKSRLPISGPISMVVPNPVDQELVEKVAASSIYAPRRSGKFEILMLASLRRFKGIDEFMALARAFSDISDIQFVLVLNADPNDVSAFRTFHRDATNVRIHSRTADPASFYATADTVINLSRVDQWIETFGLTIVEAMCFGIPVIAPPVGGPAEIITHGKDGFCIDSRDFESLINALRSLASDPVMACKMSAAAKQRSKDFTFDKYKMNLQRVFSKVHLANSTQENG